MTDYRTDETYIALLDDVLAAPGDDLPRLVLADWLDERNCCERAEFIRVQMELANMPPVRPLAEVLVDYLNGDCCEPHRAVSGCLVGNPTEVEVGAVVDWTARDIRRPVGEWSGVGVVETVGQDWHGLTVRLRPIRNVQSEQSQRARMKELRDRERELWPVEIGAYCTFRRGFVAEFRGPLAAWCGGPCGRCGGTGQRLAELIHLGIGPDCPTCGGTGTLVGCGPRIVREHPVEVVRLTDREPRYYGAGYDWITANHERPSSASSAVVPDSLFARLENWLRLTPSGHPMSGKRYRVFTTAELARAALSAALLAWAKSQPVGGA